MITGRATTAEFAAAPFGRHVTGSSWLVWAAGPDLIGSVAWHAPRPSELEQAFAIWDRLWPRLRAPLEIVTDVSRLTEVSSATYAALASYVAPRVAAMERLATRHLVLVASDGAALASGLGAGFLTAIRARHTYRVEAAPFDPSQAAAWLGRPEAVTILPQVDAIVTEVSGSDDFILAVERAIASRLPAATITSLAAALGTSERTLQRRLSAAGTNLRTLVTHARCRFATRLLVETDDKIAVIARRVGFASPSHFARVYRQIEGISPEQRRRG